MKRARATVAVLGLLGGLGAAAASGCGIIGVTCEEGLTCRVINADGTDDGRCKGACVPDWPEAFDQTAFVWMGPPADKPAECPLALTAYWVGYADLSAAYTCPSCACTEPACALPTRLTAHSAPGRLCPGGKGDTLTSFAAPKGWEGSCISPLQVPPELLGSYEVPPATQAPCTPLEAQVPFDLEPAPSWGRVAMACDILSNPFHCPLDASGRHQQCMPPLKENEPGKEWRRCIVSDDDEEVACPAGWPDRLVFHAGLDDQRGCSECTCSPVGPSECRMLMSTFQDRGCQALIDSTVVEDATRCHAVGPGTSLGSMHASWLVHEPARCEPSGGEPIGAATPVKPKTICCLKQVQTTEQEP